MNTMKFCDKCGLRLGEDCVDCPNCINNSIIDNSYVPQKKYDSLIKETLTGTEFRNKDFNLNNRQPDNEHKNTQETSVKTGRLIIERGGTEGREFPISKEISNIGRWDPNLKSHPEVDLSDEDIKAKVSRIHSRIVLKKEGFYIEDMGSRNGTYLNREYKLVKNVEYSLKDNDEVIIGHIFLRFKLNKQ